MEKIHTAGARSEFLASPSQEEVKSSMELGKSNSSSVNCRRVRKGLLCVPSSLRRGRTGWDEGSQQLRWSTASSFSMLHLSLPGKETHKLQDVF